MEPGLLIPRTRRAFPLYTQRWNKNNWIIVNIRRLMMTEDQSVILCDACDLRVTCTPAWRTRLRFDVPHYVLRHTPHTTYQVLLMSITYLF